MKHGSLFSGIGGFDLAAQWMGWDNVFHCEWMPFPRKILSHYWPEAVSYHDITTTDFRQHLGQIDILTGGFPCQPYSAAGKRKGKDDDRHLWPHMLRCIREVKPRWVVGENVFGLATWNGGLVFEEVCTDLEAEGYAVQPFVLPAAAVNAPHRRDRVWFVAHRHLHGLQQRNGDHEEHTSQGRQYAQRDFEQSNGDGDATDPQSAGSPRECKHRSWEVQPHGRSRGAIQTNFEDFPTVAPICGGDDGLPNELDGITFPKWRAESIKGYGNAIVPQVALQIFKAIQQYEEH
jgi:DNA (cytosine-5)-methyltransferase 1